MMADVSVVANFKAAAMDAVILTNSTSTCLSGSSKVTELDDADFTSSVTAGRPMEAIIWSSSLADKVGES